MMEFVHLASIQYPTTRLRMKLWKDRKLQHHQAISEPQPSTRAQAVEKLIVQASVQLEVHAKEVHN